MTEPTRQLRNAKGEMCEMQWKVMPPARQVFRWTALLRYRILDADTDGRPGTAWMDYSLHSFGGSIGYTIAAWTRKGLEKKFAEAEAKCLGFDRPPPEFVAGGGSESSEG